MPVKHSSGLILFRTKVRSQTRGESKPSTIQQVDLEEVFYYERLAHEALESRKFKLADEALAERSRLMGIVEHNLRKGAAVEKGCHGARLVADLVAGKLALEIR
jgi:hypothetical protein